VLVGEAMTIIDAIAAIMGTSGLAIIVFELSWGRR
jgi:hypothetical protein